MTKLIRFDEDHFAFMADVDISQEHAQRIMYLFEEWWPGKKMIVMHAHEFIDLTGRYEIVPISGTTLDSEESADA